MKQWIALVALGFGVGIFYNAIQERRRERIEKRTPKLKIQGAE